MSSPHPFTLSAFLIALLSFGPAAFAEEPPAKEPGKSNSRPPNIVLILADDLGFECLGCNGGKSYQTPNIDALAATGVRFTHCYATPAGPSSRAELLTGRYGFRTGWTGHIENSRFFLDSSRERTLAHRLKTAGYVTGVSGKWQLGDFVVHRNHPFDCGFDEWNLWATFVAGKPTSRYWNPVYWRDGAPREGTSGKYGPDVSCDFVIDFISRHRNEPFFLYYPTTLVHSPYDRTPGRRVDRNFAFNRDQVGEQYFASMVSYLDHIVGRIVTTIDELRLSDQTLILFTSDNGCDRGIRSRITTDSGETVVQGAKLTTTTAGFRVPLIARGFGVSSPGRTSEDLVDFTDFLPTLAEVAGTKRPEDTDTDGKSFLSILRNQEGPRRTWVYSQLGKVRLVRDQRYVLFDDGRLFDVATDPQQQRPLVAGTDLDADEARLRLTEALDLLE
ncbi:MAG: sulfatase-like hydrolase/transferase [Planctomycetota bacterium]